MKAGEADKLSQALFWLVWHTPEVDLMEYSSMVQGFLGVHAKVIQANDVMNIIKQAIEEGRLVWRPADEFGIPQLSDLLKANGFKPIVGSASRYEHVRSLVISTNDGAQIRW